MRIIVCGCTGWSWLERASILPDLRLFPLLLKVLLLKTLLLFVGAKVGDEVGAEGATVGALVGAKDGDEVGA